MSSSNPQFKNKAEFVRSMSFATKAADVIAAGKRAGFPNITNGDVYAARSNAKARMARDYGPKKSAKKGERAYRITELGRQRSEARAYLKPSGSGASLEAEFRKLVLRVGLDRAQQWISSIANESLRASA